MLSWPSPVGCAARGSAGSCSAVFPRVLETPMMRPGMARTKASRVAKKGSVGTAETHGNAEALTRSEGDVGAHRAGGLSSTRAMRSLATATVAPREP